ncbi:MAG: hypothetical protein GEU79_08545 [Acidimicrobiia bacterium]|nr:hypothetical protein [Acidimicrobiia bacterium]
MKSKPFRRLVGAVVPPMVDRGIPVEVGGSGALLLRGADVEPGDLDLLVPEESLGAIRDLIPDGHLDTSHAGPWLTSWRYRWDSVEALGGAVLRDGAEPWVIPLGDPDLVIVDDVEIPLSPLAVWIRIYRIIGSDRLSIAEAL